MTKEARTGDFYFRQKRHLNCFCNTYIIEILKKQRNLTRERTGFNAMLHNMKKKGDLGYQILKLSIIIQFYFLESKLTKSIPHPTEPKTQRITH